MRWAGRITRIEEMYAKVSRKNLKGRDRFRDLGVKRGNIDIYIYIYIY
jgi:hypothetical protein